MAKTLLLTAATLMGAACNESTSPRPPAGQPTVASVTVAPPLDTLLAGSAVQLTATTKDSAGNVLTGRAVTWASSNTAVATVNSTGLVTGAAAGRATVTGTSAGKGGTAAITVTTARLAFTAQPSNATAGVAISPAVTVTIQDASANTMTSATDLVTVALETNPSGGMLLGTTPVHAVNGVATFSNLSIQVARTGYALTASSPTLTGATSAPFAVAPAAAAKVAFAVQPSTTDILAQPITPAIQVTIQDAFANMVTSATNAVTLVLATNPGGSTLSGTTTVTAVNGIAVFADLRVDGSGTGYTLAATSGTLAGATSAAFDVTVPLTFVAVNAGGYDSCGLTAAGAAYCWGSDEMGELGNRSTSGQLIPVAVAGGLVFATVTAGGGDYYVEHTCGLTPGGAAYCWGTNSSGQLGVLGSMEECFENNEAGGQNEPCSTTPRAVAGGLTFVAIALGGDHTCGITIAGAAYCWGSNYYGQLGDGTGSSPVPATVSGGLTFKAVTAGNTHTCALTPGGAAYCWGGNDAGQLGTGDTVSRSQPAAVAAGLTFQAISAGYDYTCAVTAAGAAYCWGSNAAGQLGDGTATQRTSPVAVVGRLIFATLSAGGALGAATCGVTPAGATYCWGYNGNGQLGDGTTTQRTSPVPVLGGLTFATVSAGGAHTCGVTPAGAAYCWGSNVTGQLGDRTTTDRLSPVRVLQ